MNWGVVGGNKGRKKRYPQGVRGKKGKGKSGNYILTRL